MTDRVLRVGELCTGYGGLALAVEHVFNAETVWVAENNPAAQRVLETHWPGVPNLGDITRINWQEVPPVDILAGGTPCQDLSVAGLRAGMTETTRSGLWGCMRDAIATLQPRYVIWENVNGARSATATSLLEPDPGCLGNRSGGPALRAAGRVLGDLASLGYDAEWRTVQASDVGACHRRARLFVFAWDATASPVSELGGVRRQPIPNETGREPQNDTATRRRRASAADPNRAGLERRNTPSGGGAVERPAGTGGVDPDSPAWGRYRAAVKRHARMLGGPPPAPTKPGRHGRPRLAPEFVEWMMALPTGWVTDVPGVTRKQLLVMLGNGVVTPQAVAALRDMTAAAGVTL